MCCMSHLVTTGSWESWRTGIRSFIQDWWTIFQLETDIYNEKINLFAKALFIQGASRMFTQPGRPFCSNDPFGNCLLWVQKRPVSANYVNHGAAETSESCLCPVRFCRGGVESPALSNPLLCVCICSAASRKPVRSCASLWDVRAVFSPPHIQDFSPKRYSRTF